MSFEDHREDLKFAVDQIGKSRISNEALAARTRRQARSYTLRPDVIEAINNTADQQHVSASHLVEKILINYFEL